MNYTKTLSALRSRVLVAVAVVAIAAALAGCGSSGSSSTITIGNENPGDTALANVSGSETSTASAKTPTTGPLSKEPHVTPPSGPPPTTLVKTDLIVGTGPEAKDGDTVTVNYVGVLYHSGKEFDASWKRNEPFTFPLGKGAVIPGWDQGVVGMKVGGRRELVIPADLAYGAKGSPPTIPPNEPLVFVVDLLAV